MLGNGNSIESVPGIISPEAASTYLECLQRRWGKVVGRCLQVFSEACSHAGTQGPTTSDARRLSSIWPGLAPVLDSIQTEELQFGVLAERLRASQSLLRSRFGFRLPVSDIESTSMGHHSFRDEALILQDAMGARVVYKPRPLVNASCWYRFLKDITREIEITNLAIDVQVADCGQYGWMQHLPPLGPASTVLACRSLGTLICLASLAGVQDGHAQNVRTLDGLPALVDLEIVLAPSLSRAVDWRPVETSLLTCVDSMNAGPSAPTTGLQSRVGSHIIEGYRYSYDQIRKSRRAALGIAAASLTDCDPRIVVRPTKFYRALLEASLNPTRMSSIGSRDRFLEKHLRAAPSVATQWPTHDQELHSLKSLRIPRMRESQLQAKNVLPPQGSGIEALSARLDSMSDAELSKDIRSIQERLACAS